MKRLFVIDEHLSSRQNGIGTFMSNLFKCMDKEEITFSLISYNEENVTEFSISEEKDLTIYKFPIIAKGVFMENALLSVAILKRYIIDSEDNVFLVSNSPCSKYLKALKQLFPKSKRYFVIHDQGWTAPLLGDKNRLLNILAPKASVAEEKEVCRYIRYYTKEEKKIYQYAHKVICLCNTTKQLLVDVYNIPKEKIVLIPNGLDNDIHLNQEEKQNIRLKLGLAPSDLIILYVGRMVEAKGLKELLEAFEILFNQNSKVRLVIVGEVFNLNQFVKYTPNSSTHITYTGLIGKERLNEWYEISDIGILPSYTEQCSYTAIEMMLHKLPIITTCGNGLKDMFTDRENAIVLSPDKSTLTDSIVSAIIYVMRCRKSEIHTMVENAYKRATTEYSIENMSRKYFNIICEQ